MTHSLHRVGTEESLSRDFVVASRCAVGINSEGHEPKLEAFLRLAQKHNPNNYGVGVYGNKYGGDGEQVIKHAREMAHAVFTSGDDVGAFLKDLKEADLGMSVIVSGVLDTVNEIVKKAGLKRHTVNLSLGVWGNTNRLPPTEIMEVTTMCGHGMIAPTLVEKLIEDIRKSAKTPKAAAEELAAPCCCGIFNADRATELLAAAAGKN